MHASSRENMEKCYSRYIQGGPIEEREIVRLLDMGGTDVNGSYRDIFCHPRFAYTAADIVSGPGVHLVLNDPYRIPLDDQSMDIVLSGQMLEHCEFFWLTFAEMVRVLKPGGYLFLIAPSDGPEHRYPVDCYRFYPDAYRALARHANCQLIDVWLDERGPWRDLVGVFQRYGPPASAEPLQLRTVVQPSDIVAGSDEEERINGETFYLDILNVLHEVLCPKCYVEIGIRHGKSLSLARGPAIGIDPAPELTVDIPDTIRIFAETSDHFFTETAATVLSDPIDFAFIDGLHTFEAALRDFMHIEERATLDAVVVIDDIAPNHPAQAERDRRTRVWTGDVWKLVLILQRYRPDLTLVQLNTSPSGCLLISGLDPANRILWDQYNPIVREAMDWPKPSTDILERHNVISPRSLAWKDYVAALAQGQSRPTALQQLADVSSIEILP